MTGNSIKSIEHDNFQSPIAPFCRVYEICLNFARIDNERFKLIENNLISFWFEEKYFPILTVKSS